MGRPRCDMWRVALWEDVLTVNGNEVYYRYQVYNEAIVVPESIDAIRTLTCTIKNGKDSIRITDEAIGIKKDFLVKQQKVIYLICLCVILS